MHLLFERLRTFQQSQWSLQQSLRAVASQLLQVADTERERDRFGGYSLNLLRPEEQVSEATAACAHLLSEGMGAGPLATSLTLVAAVQFELGSNKAMRELLKVPNQSPILYLYLYLNLYLYLYHYLYHYLYIYLYIYLYLYLYLYHYL